MDELAGIILPMLLSGADVMDVLRAITGAGRGASNDGLQAMLQSQMRNAVRKFPLKLTSDDKTLQAGAGLFIDNLGINPLTGFGQGATKALMAAYQFAPGIVGSLIGVPSPGTFFHNIANGAGGVGLASGAGMPQMFNPYSVMAAHERAMNLAKTVYDIGTDGGKGYNVDFGHGLNFSEMGLVSQRLLSSRLPYVDENGKVLNPMDDTVMEGQDKSEAEKFRDNVKKFGSKFNEAASMLAKVTGSVEEAINVMDRMAGGNFLGGTAQQASDVANRARKMAAAIRVTSAMAGVSPQETFARMSVMENGIMQSMGVSPTIAKASGYGGFMDAAYTGTMAYNQWAASNPNATQTQKQQAWLGAQYRTNAYFQSNGADLAAIVAANKDMFSEEDLRKIQSDYASGKPNNALRMIEDRIGANKVRALRADPSAIMAARMYGDQETLRAIDISGIQGNLQEAEIAGARRDLNLTMSDIESKMSDAKGGSYGRTKERREAEANALRDLAVKNGLTAEAAGGMKVGQLERYLANRPGLDPRVVERVRNTAAIEDQSRYIRENTMSAGEENAARSKLLAEIDAPGSHVNEEERNKLREMIQKGDLNGAFERFYDKNVFSTKDIRDKRKDIFGGRLTSGQSREMSSRLDEQRMAQSVESTPEEYRQAYEAQARKESMDASGRLLGFIADKNEKTGAFKNAKTDKEALQALSGRIGDLAKERKIRLEDGDVSKATDSAISGIVESVFQGNVGNLESTKDGKPNKLYEDLKSTVAKSMKDKIAGGKSVHEAFALAMAELKDNEKFASAIGKNDKGEIANGQIDRWIRKSGEEDSDLRRETLTRDKLGAGVVSELQKSMENKIDGSALKGDTDESRKAYSAGVGKLIEQALGKDAKGIDVAGISKSVVDDYFDKGKSGKNGNWNASAAEKLKKAAEEKGIGEDRRKALLSAAESIESMTDVSETVYRNTLEASGAASVSGMVDARGFRGSGKFAASMTKDQNAAMSVYAASQQRLGFNGVEIPQEVANLVSAMDIVDANRKQNALRNAINVGGGSFAQETIDQSKANVANLQKALEAGGVDAKVAEVALYGKEDTEGAKNAKSEAMKILKKAVAKTEGMDEKSALEMTRALMDPNAAFGKDRKIKGRDVLFGGEGALKDVSDKKYSQDWARVTKEANKQDSVAYDIFSLVSSFAEGAAKFFAQPVHEVRLAGGSTMN